MSKVTALVVAASFAMLGAVGAFAQGVPEWKDVRIGTPDSWIRETDMVVRRFVLQDVPYQSFGNFVGVAFVEFTNRTATEYEFGVNRQELAFISDTVLRPGTVIHLDALDITTVPVCGDVADPKTETCRTSMVFRTVSMYIR